MTIDEIKHFSFVQWFESDEIKKITHPPFKNQPQFPALLDILSRKNHHHVFLQHHFSQHLYPYFFTALVHYLSHSAIPEKIRDSDLILLDTEDPEFDLQKIKPFLYAIDRCFILALTNWHASCQPLLSHPLLRCILLQTNPQQKNLQTFASLNVAGPTSSDVMAILKEQRTQLEHFHHVVIPEELLGQAYSLAEHYLSLNDPLQATLELLDSSAARASIHEEGQIQFKPVVSFTTLTEVLSHRTNISPARLQSPKIPVREFVANIQQTIFGQEPAINTLAQSLQHIHTSLRSQTKPLQRFIFVGPKHSGKKTTVLAFTQEWLGHQDALYFVPHRLTDVSDFADMPVQHFLDQQFIPLKEVVQKKPYAIFVFDELDEMNRPMIDGLWQLLHTGFLHDDQGHRYHFQQATIILLKTIEPQQIQKLVDEVAEEENPKMDLLHLVMNERQKEPLTIGAGKEWIEDVRTRLEATLPKLLIKQFILVPFLPLNKLALEKIMQLQLKRLSQLLETRHHVEFGFAPEVISFLCQEALMADPPNPEKALQTLYASVEQALYQPMDQIKPRSNQLFLQLNETGQMLRCEWLLMNIAREGKL